MNTCKGGDGQEKRGMWALPGRLPPSTNRKALAMPGPVSDAYDPEFGTVANADMIADAIREVILKINNTLGSELLPILGVVEGRRLNGKKLIFNERHLRIIRFALIRAVECL